MSRVEVKRLNSREVERLKGTESVWYVCRFCHDSIPASRRHHAYCDVRCKKRSMISEM